MKKYEKFTREQLQQFCNESQSYRELAKKIGYSPNGGSTIRLMKQIVEEYDLSWENYKGQAHGNNTGNYKTPIEDYLTNKVKITSHKLRLRLLEEKIFEPKCSMCHNSEWLNNLIPLELHHKNGNKDDNTLDNLELLCPNCHVFTDTYKSKNRS